MTAWVFSLWQLFRWKIGNDWMPELLGFVLLTFGYFVGSLVVVMGMQGRDIAAATLIVAIVMFPVSLIAGFLGWSFSTWADLFRGVTSIIVVSTTEEVLRSFAIWKFCKGRDANSTEKFIVLISVLYGLSENIPHHFAAYVKTVQFIYIFFTDFHSLTNTPTNLIPVTLTNFVSVFIYATNLFLKVALHFWLMRVCVFALVNKNPASILVGISVHIVSNMNLLALSIFNQTLPPQPGANPLALLSTLNFLLAVLILFIWFKSKLSAQTVVNRPD